jgi:hypothetical protein
MAAGFGWIDFSDEQRDRVYAVIDLLSSSGTVDELGVGTIRDSLADWMFPGVSTIQTRPKYFIILSEILLNYISKYLKNEKLPSLEDYFTGEENRIMKVLAENHGYAEGQGIIGVTVARKNEELARKASFVYWNGMRIHGLVNTHLSRNEYVKTHDLSEYINEDDSHENFEHDFGLKGHQLHVIDDHMTMELTKDQANFLRDQFLDTSHADKQDHNLLTEILRDRSRQQIILNASNFREAADLLLEVDDLPNESKGILRMALDFDQLVHGAHIRYNIQLHAKAGLEKNTYQDDWEKWLAGLEASRVNMENLDFNAVFSQVAKRVDSKTIRFMKAWQTEVLQSPIDELALDDLVYNQEISKKGGKAKLTLKDGEFTSWVGIYGLQYRFNIVKNIITDLQASYA